VVAVAGAGQIYTSINFGTNWTPRAANSAWIAVASSANGSNLVAAAFNPAGTGGQIATSTNAGFTWTGHETNRHWWAVASSADGTKLIAGIIGGQLYVSTNAGTLWTATAFTNRWSALACSSDGAKLIAAADVSTGTGRIYLSPPLVSPPPSLAILRTSTNTVVISWPSPSSDWNVQQSTNQPDASWNTPSESISDDGTNKFIIVNPPAGNRFFRLIKP
jgi:hypothetical protein